MEINVNTSKLIAVVIGKFLKYTGIKMSDEEIKNLLIKLENDEDYKNALINLIKIK